MEQDRFKSPWLYLDNCNSSFVLMGYEKPDTDCYWRPTRCSCRVDFLSIDDWRHMITLLLIFQVVPFDKPIFVLGLFTLFKLPKRPCKGTLKSELDVWPVVDCLAINHIGRVIFTLLLPTNTNWAILISLSNFFIYLHLTRAFFRFKQILS